MSKYQRKMNIPEAVKQLDERIHAEPKVPADDEIETLLYAFSYEHEFAQTTLNRLNELKQKIQQVDRSMECTLESDPRTLSNRDCEFGFIFDRIYEWRKLLNE